MADRFRKQHRKLDENEIASIGEIKDKAEELEGLIRASASEGPSVDLAVQKLQEAVFWSTHAITA